MGRTLWRVFDRPVAAGLSRGRAELNATRRRLGLAPVQRFHGGLSERLVMIATYPELEYPRDWPDHVHVVGPMVWEPPTEPVAPPSGDAPLVIVAPSTAQDPDHRLLRAALAGLGREPIRVLATWNRRPLPGPATVPANTRLVSWISYAQTMTGANVVICHAGHGTLVRAIASRATVVAVPHAGDMAENAARADWAGVGVRLPWALLGPRSLALTVRRALERPELAARVAEVSARTPLQAGPARAADLCEQLAARGAVDEAGGRSVPRRPRRAAAAARAGRVRLRPADDLLRALDPGAVVEDQQWYPRVARRLAHLTPAREQIVERRGQQPEPVGAHDLGAMPGVDQCLVGLATGMGVNRLSGRPRAVTDVELHRSLESPIGGEKAPGVGLEPTTLRLTAECSAN